MCNEIETPTYKVQKTNWRLITMAKEILKDEILKDEELEQVAGGNRDELALDTQLFNALGD
ncbi:MAG: hypothetical protein IKK40_07380, partial [Bacteroidales bacterium]|nr:hypothetical protein [Bacteroidales bacterium]